MPKMIKAANFEEYVSQFPKDIQEKLMSMRNLVRGTAPGAEEGISYGIPAYKLYGKSLVYFAAQ